VLLHSSNKFRNKNLFYLDERNDEMDQSLGMEDDTTQAYDETLLLKSIFNIKSIYFFVFFFFLILGIDNRINDSNSVRQH
jgi:hypothetical protein